MKLQTKTPVQRSARPPGRTASRQAHSTLRQTPAGRRLPAILRGWRYDGRSLRCLLRPARGQRSDKSERSAPLFGLILIGMHEMRRQTRNPGRSVLLLLSVFALLTLACFPILAQADSAGTQYSEPRPTATGEYPQSHHEPPAHASTVGGGSSTGTTTGKRSSTGHPSSTPRRDLNARRSTRRARRSTGQASPHAGLPGTSQTSQPASSSDIGGSSPLVPILIAIAALAAISIGVVTMRARHHRADGGASVSP